MLKLDQVGKKLDHFTMEGMSFTLPMGYIMGLAGENGAGKTTLLKMIAGGMPVDQGDISFLDMRYPEDENRLKDEIGFIFRENLFWPSMMLSECADMAGSYYSRYDKEKLRSYLKEFGLAEDKKIGKLSEGEKMKFQFAFAFSHDPKLLLIDEATGSFDPTFREKMQKMMTDFVSDGEHSILFSSHVTDEMERIADYILLIHEGKVVFCMDRESLLDKYRIVQGPKYKINLLRKEDIIYVEESAVGTTAFIEYYKGHQEFDINTGVRKGTITEVLYYMMKKLKGKKR